MSDASQLPNPRVWVEIDLNKIKSNYAKIAAAVKPLKVMAILKANAYGLGLIPVARALVSAGVTAIGVAELREALAIISLGVPVQIIGGVIGDEIHFIVEHGIIAPITDYEVACALSREAVRQGKTVECCFIIDTGMGRLGILAAQAESVIRETVKLPGLRCSGISSHFPIAYGDIEFSRAQIKRLSMLISRLEKQGISFSAIHIANSDGINNVPESYFPNFTMVRTGINLYGVFDLEGKQSLTLEPVLTLKTRLVAKRLLPSGMSIGYGRSYITTRPTLVGTISIGYADGLPLAMSNRGDVLVHGKRCNILGRVSMDYTCISLEPVPHVKIGDEIICLGAGIGIHEWTEAKKSISYEIICSLGNRVERRYI